jgi:hypothetical protein
MIDEQGRNTIMAEKGDIGPENFYRWNVKPK